MIEFNENFDKLFIEVKEHRAKMSICPSAQPGVDVADIINEFCENGFYEDDYHTITKYFAEDMVEYKDTIYQMQNLRNLK